MSENRVIREELLNSSISRDQVANRLSMLAELEDILPTRVADIDSIDRSAISDLDSLDMDDGVRNEVLAESLHRSVSNSSLGEPATEIFLSNHEMRDQLMSFLRSGIGFYRADSKTRKMAPTERVVLGGHSDVTRVLTLNDRIYLETSRLLVRFRHEATDAERAQLIQDHRLHVLPSPWLAIDTVRCICSDALATRVCLQLMESPLVAHASPDFIEQLKGRYTPSDSEYSSQWHHQNIGSEFAWDFSQGQNINIAVIDNGFDLSHPDLSNRISSLTGYFRETPDYVDADFIANGDYYPDSNHGTACAGMIGGRDPGGQGGCGVAIDCLLSPIACGADQIGSQSTLARAIGYAAEPRLERPDDDLLGADIIACSLGPNGASWAMQPILNDAIDFATASGREGRGCAIFWACTNGNYPIAMDEVCSHPDVIAVGRSTLHDSDDGSGFGPELEFLAPGVGVWIPRSGGGHHTTTGTSFAAPCAAGVAGLALAANPSLTYQALRAVMKQSCDQVGGLLYEEDRNDRFGYGRINAAEAVSLA